MKSCPACQQTYEDDSMDYCLNDGVQLVSATPASDPQATLHIPSPRSTDPNTPPQQESWQTAGPTYTPPVAPTGQRNWLPWILGGVALLIFGAIGIVGVAGFLLYKMSAPSASSDRPSYNSNKTNTNASGSDSGTRRPVGSSSSSPAAKESLADTSAQPVTDLALQRVGNYKLGGTKIPQGHLFKNEGATELTMATYDRTDGTNFVLLYIASFSTSEKAQSALDEIIRWSVGQGARIQNQESNTAAGNEELGKKYVLVNGDGVEDVYWTNGRYAFNAYNGKKETGVLTAFEKSYPY
ncbi:MAG TPA: hypothetical protein VF708_21390 [Pyrinomonadaceae bacterium]